MTKYQPEPIFDETTGECVARIVHDDHPSLPYILCWPGRRSLHNDAPLRFGTFAQAETVARKDRPRR